MVLVAASVLIAGIVAGPLIGGGGVACVALIAYLVRRRRRSALRHRAAEQIADAVSALSAGLRAGLSLPQAFAYARDEAEEPLRGELASLVDGIDTGTPISEALAEWADAHDSEDARLIAGVLDLHRRSGGDLPIVLDGLAGTLRERRAAHREVRALTAQARLSGVILGMLPIGFFAFLLRDVAGGRWSTRSPRRSGGPRSASGSVSRCWRSSGSGTSWRSGDGGARGGVLRRPGSRMRRRRCRPRHASEPRPEEGSIAPMPATSGWSSPR